MPAALLSAEEVVEEVIGMAPWRWAVAEVPMTPTLNLSRCQVLALVARWWERVHPCPRSDPTGHVGAWTRDLAARGDAAAECSLSPRVSP